MNTLGILLAKMLCLAALLASVSSSAKDSVVVYTSVDQEFAEVLLKEAGQAIGVEVKPVFDAEAAKTVGLERRLVSEKARPRADVFWNSEYLRTLRLARDSVLAARARAGGPELPAAYQGAEFIGVGIRARIIAVNTAKISLADAPRRMEDLADPKWKGRVAIAKPLFGTTSTHFAALHAEWGEKRFVEFLKALKANDVKLLPGNGDVRDAVVEGRVAIGLTDTDDAVGAIRRKQPLAMVFPDQDGEGAFGVFQTIALVRNGPNPSAAEKLVGYLSSSRAEQRLVELGAVQIPVRSGLKMAPEIADERPKIWHVAEPRLLQSLDASVKLIQQYLL